MTRPSGAGHDEAYCAVRKKLAEMKDPRILNLHLDVTGDGDFIAGYRGC